MVRGTFANVRLRNLLVEGSEGTWTAHLPDGEEMTIFAAAERYHGEGVPLVVLAGKEYGSGSSRDWAAKGPNLLGVRAVIAETYERIHRSNLIGMGIVPLQYPDGESAESLGLTGREEFAVEGLENGEASEVQVTQAGRRRAGRLHRPRAPGHSPRARLPAPRRDPALRPAQARGLVLDLHPLDQAVTHGVDVADALVGEQLALAGVDDLVDVDGDASVLLREALRLHARGRSSRTAAPSTRGRPRAHGRARPRSHSASRRPGA